MHHDVGELSDFYAQPLGIAVRRLLTHRLRARWRNVRGETVIGLGYAPPFLGPYHDEALRVGAIMPATQGAIVWPREGDKLTVLADEEHLPLADNSVDKLLAVHCLETAGQVRPLLREIWRVLSPQGRIMLIVPNRRSIWARSDNTPFGHGRPYSRGQLERLFDEAMFTTTGWQYALHAPPIGHHLVLRYVTGLERVGSMLWPGIGGVIMVEGRKELLAPTGRLKTATAMGRLVTVPAPKSARGSAAHTINRNPAARRNRQSRLPRP
ncbi:MAG: class I SAM-dependent methyltransferase [Alphaproteobacteria bacterium]|nr:class I SAM-dependent methyltransferase [Alphaproteobacteria bacterium]